MVHNSLAGWGKICALITGSRIVILYHELKLRSWMKIRRELKSDYFHLEKQIKIKILPANVRRYHKKIIFKNQ